MMSEALQMTEYAGPFLSIAPHVWDSGSAQAGRQRLTCSLPTSEPSEPLSIDAFLDLFALFSSSWNVRALLQERWLHTLQAFNY